MSLFPADAFDAGRLVADALEEQRLPYAIGGGISYGLWAPPRATNDADVNVFVEPARFGEVVAALQRAGVSVDAAAALRGMEEGGQFVAYFGPWRIDVYVPSIDFSWEAHRTRREKEWHGRFYWFLAPEALCVFKLLYFRPKDLVDLERLLTTQGRRLDAAYVRRWIADMMGEDDVRVARWDELTALFWRDPPPPGE